MAGNLQALRRRIRSVTSTRKITKAQELVAASRIGKAQERVDAARPYADAITGVLAALADRARVDHPLLVPRQRPRRAGVLIVTSDRGLCGAYNANVIREAEGLINTLRSDGREVVQYVVGRKGIAYYRFRDRPIAASWSGFSERPTVDHAREAGATLVDAFLSGSDGTVGGTVGGDDDAGIDELYLVYTQFRTLMTQTPVAVRLAPVEIVEPSAAERAAGSGHGTGPTGGSERDGGSESAAGPERVGEGEPTAAYEFEPEPEQLLAALMPKYVDTRIYAALLDAAASESASRRRAMKSATDNADELITAYTRQMNSARQAAITQEISEIVGGANALAAAGSDM